MDQTGMVVADLVPYIGPRNRVYEVPQRHPAADHADDPAPADTEHSGVFAGWAAGDGKLRTPGASLLRARPIFGCAAIIRNCALSWSTQRSAAAGLSSAM